MVGGDTDSKDRERRWKTFDEEKRESGREREEWGRRVSGNEGLKRNGDCKCKVWQKQNNNSDMWGSANYGFNLVPRLS